MEARDLRLCATYGLKGFESNISDCSVYNKFPLIFGFGANIDVLKMVGCEKLLCSVCPIFLVGEKELLDIYIFNAGADGSRFRM